MDNQDNATQIPQAMPTVVENPTTPPPVKRNKWKLPLIIGGSVALLLIIGGLLWWFLRPTNPLKPDTDLIPAANSDGKWGYVDKKGNWVINPQFEGAYWFTDGVALVKNSDNKLGYINKQGQYTIQAQYSQASPFYEGLAFVVKEGGYPICIDTKGSTVFELRDAEQVMCFKEGLAPYCVEDKSNKESGTTYKWGFVDKKGNVVIPPQFKKVGQFYEGLAAFGKEDHEEMKYGYIDKKGQIVINAQFDEAGNFSEGLSMVRSGEKYGYIDKKGSYAINPQFDGAMPFFDGKAGVQQNDQWGFIDKNGKLVINPQFEHVGPFIFGEGIALFSNGDECGFIDGTGKYVINPQFNYALPFVNGIAFVNDGKNWGFIDKKGKYIVNPQFSEVAMPLLELNWRVNSEYYNASKFVTAFFSNFSSSQADGLTISNPTLRDIDANPKYQSEWEDHAYYQSIHIYLSEAITGDITLDDVRFEFENEIKYYDWDNNSYNYDGSAECTAAEYSFTLENKAADKSATIAIAVCDKLKSLYGGKISPLSYDNAKKVECGSINFIVKNYYGSLELNVFFDQNAFQEELQKYEEKETAIQETTTYGDYYDDYDDSINEQVPVEEAAEYPAW